MAEQKLLKMKNDFHLEVAGWIKKLSPDSNLEKEIGLHNPPQVSGYFCVKQSVFLWIVLTEGRSLSTYKKVEVLHLASALMEHFLQGSSPLGP